MSLRETLIRNFDEAPLETSTRAPMYDGSRSAGVIGARQGLPGRKIGCGIDIVPPGKRACPYHFHYAQEEVFIVLEGQGTLRVAGEMLPIRAGDVISIPPGPEYPHQIINTSDAPLKYLSLSTLEFPEVCEYPDSGKYLAYTRTDGPLLQRGRMHRADTDLDYWDGEA
ncbi:MAG: cupin domain-containing protein [Burkholderiaceae bacterium]|nr:cupin domain-containing protein [Burkholderiaceae bacterium]